MGETLFPPNPQERLDAIEVFIQTERGHRERMVARHPQQSEYWQARVDDADRALAHLEALRGDIQRGG